MDTSGTTMMMMMTTYSIAQTHRGVTDWVANTVPVFCLFSFLLSSRCLCSWSMHPHNVSTSSLKFKPVKTWCLSVRNFVLWTTNISDVRQFRMKNYYLKAIEFCLNVSEREGESEWEREFSLHRKLQNLASGYAEWATSGGCHDEWNDAQIR